jgi:hypothetical protein
MINQLCDSTTTMIEDRRRLRVVKDSSQGESQNGQSNRGGSCASLSLSLGRLGVLRASPLSLLGQIASIFWVTEDESELHMKLWV